MPGLECPRKRTAPPSRSAPVGSRSRPTGSFPPILLTPARRDRTPGVPAAALRSAKGVVPSRDELGSPCLQLPWVIAPAEISAFAVAAVAHPDAVADVHPAGRP